MFRKLPGIGLDIGSQKIKMIRVAHKRSQLELIRYGSTPTPAGTIKGGIIVDPEGLGAEIRYLVKDLKLSGQRTVSALGGQQIFMRNICIPNVKAGELDDAIWYQAMHLLPIPVEEAVMDHYVVRQVDTAQGRNTEILLVAVGKNQVENIKLACHIAGLKLAVLEVEPQALFRMVGDAASVTAILNVGWTRSYVFIFKRGVPVFFRAISVGSSVGANLSESYPASIVDAGAVQTTIQMKSKQNGPEYLVSEVKAAVEYYQASQNGLEDNIQKIWVNGGSRLRDLANRLVRATGCEVEAVGIGKRLRLSADINQRVRQELQQDFLIALGLAAREVY
ncbi:MAG: pilus assembly protein PilM [Syntrophomonadaceae bacterium]|nr:pilus assembly protein PilM [Syntrophomonadaceae bacterium]